ncbi:MAG: hydantoinase/oxoprolinase family protein [Deltaproteobacteria bacterium]|nr:hydantoinase/oxoprolinase family protein [Deltaproteobacteria bacterium]
MSFRIGIDVGGTFTDLFVWSEKDGIETYKTLSTPEDPSIGVLEGLKLIAAAHHLPLGDFVGQVETVVHGTTVTTNASLTRGGAKTGLLTTEGVRDALEMRRGIREAQYDNHTTNVEPLVPRALRRPVRERLDWQGRELVPLDLGSVREAVAIFRRERVEAVAICFMNSFANPAHEQAARALVSQELPGAFLSVSSELMPTVRFYNRVSTTAINAYVGPILKKYLESLTRRLAEIGYQGVLLIMQSNGGVARPEATMERPAGTLLSGPAAGPSAGAVFVDAGGASDAIVVDMGGTSFDASLVRKGRATLANEGEIDRLRIALPMLSITTIGAGGGSIGWIDEGGLLRVGPKSAGAQPGPACYGRGGERPTVTDANVVLGYLDPAYFAGGRLKLDPERAHRAIQEHVARPLRLEVEEAAAGMYRVINANMAHGVRETTVKRGVDPRELPLVVAGGAGALHGAMIARELQMPHVLVPSVASVLCAMGMLLSDLQHDFVRSYVTRFKELDRRRLRALVDEMIADGERQLASEGVAKARAQHEVLLDLRYLKQYHEVTVPAPYEVVAGGDLERVMAAFHAEHDRLYGYELSKEGTDLELINVRVRSIGATPKPPLPRAASGGKDPARAEKGRRRAYVPETGAFAELPVYDGHQLQAGNVIPGPALIERSDTTIVVSQSFTATVDVHGSCHLKVHGRPS